MREDFIEKRSDVIKNLLTLYHYAVSENEEQQQYAFNRYKQGKWFVVEKIGDKLFFGPSQFVGYKNNSIEKHTENHGNGTDTNSNFKKLSMYSEIKDNEFLVKKYNDFLAELGLEKNTPPAFLIPQTIDIGDLKKTASCYFISPTHCSGYKSEAWRSFLDNELMAIGWEDEDYTNLSIDEVYAIYTGDNSAIQAFSNLKEVKYGDIVCATNNNHGLWGIGVALSSYKYSEHIHYAGQDKEENECYYSHYADIAWLDYDTNRKDYIKQTDLNITKAEKLWPPYGTLFKPPVFPQYILRYLLKTNLMLIDNMEVKEIIELLKHKKQIILQGAPGTGKTYLAKKIARELVNKNIKKEIPSTITEDIIKVNLSIGEEIYTTKGLSKYTVKDFNDTGVGISKKNDDYFLVYYHNIISAYNNGEFSGTHEHFAIAKHLFVKLGKDNKLDTSSVKLIQFHPSYTYEDFVRGIEVKTENGQPDYITRNKVLGEFAELASKNWQDSQKSAEEVSKEEWLTEQFDKFVDFVNEEAVLNLDNDYQLTDSVNIIAVEADAFRYAGKNWKHGSNRMLFKDIKQAYLDDNKTRQDIKKNQNLSGLAQQHASYYIRVLDNFREYIESEKITYSPSHKSKVELENYVLIIDEINRANLPAVLGELIYALEYRGEKVESMYAVDGKNELILPPNLYIIGTMNTADRSVGQIDYAIRRRFAFIDMLPKSLSGEVDNFDEDLFKKVSAFFIENIEEYITNPNVALKKSEYLSDEFSPEDVWIGHSYFIMKEENREMRLNYEIKPILREYLKDGILKENVNGEDTKTAINSL